ncbi:reverse transcriptase domain-containing protein [Tanacetum coccineum]
MKNSPMISWQADDLQEHGLVYRWVSCIEWFLRRVDIDKLERRIEFSTHEKTDALSKIASTSFAHLSKQVLVEELKEKSIHDKEVLAIVEEEGQTWMTPICEYLTKEILPEDKKKARVDTSLQTTSLRKYRQDSTVDALGPRILGRSRLSGRDFTGHQMHTDGGLPSASPSRSPQMMPSPSSHFEIHQTKLNPITSPWSFYKWGIDIAGPFPEGPGKVKFLIVSIDYFTKWIEAKSVATITTQANGWSKEKTGVWSKESKLDWLKSKDWDRKTYNASYGHTHHDKIQDGETLYLNNSNEAVNTRRVGMQTLGLQELGLDQNDEIDWK